MAFKGWPRFGQGLEVGSGRTKIVKRAKEKGEVFSTEVARRPVWLELHHLTPYGFWVAYVGRLQSQPAMKRPV